MITSIGYSKSLYVHFERVVCNPQKINAFLQLTGFNAERAAEAVYFHNSAVYVNDCSFPEIIVGGFDVDGAASFYKGRNHCERR